MMFKLSEIDDLLKEFGKVLTLKSVSNGTYDPSTGDISNTETTTTIIGLVKDYSSNELVDSLVLVGDRKITVSGSVSEPKPTDKITIDSIDWTIISVGGVWDGEAKAMHILQVRK